MENWKSLLLCLIQLIAQPFKRGNVAEMDGFYFWKVNVLTVFFYLYSSLYNRLHMVPSHWSCNQINTEKGSILVILGLNWEMSIMLSLSELPINI